MKYRNRMVEIEANKFTYLNKDKVYQWARQYQYNIQPSFNKGAPCLLIPTAERELQCNLGDYLIRDTNGEFYVCESSLFENLYEPVE